MRFAQMKMLKCKDGKFDILKIYKIQDIIYIRLGFK